jgi:molecular chaperone GrpE
MNKKAKHNTEEQEKEMEKTDNVAAEQNQQTIEAEKTAEESVADSQVDNSKEQVDYEAQILEWKDKYVRLSAEFDNYRKRTLKEKIELTQYANENILKEILPVVDDFERGLKNVDLAKDVDAVKEGINLIYNKFCDFLTQKGMKEIEAMNSEFNTDFHEAITKIPVENKELSGKIVDVVLKGYMLNEKVVRYSKVVVGE